MRRFVLLAAFLFIVAPFAAACSCGSGGPCHCAGTCGCAGGHPTPPPAPVVQDDIVSLAVGAPIVAHVGVGDFFFAPADLTIHVGDTVQWDWISGGHTVTSVIGSAEQFDSGFQFGGSFSHTFTNAGTFTYYCQVHGFDNGDGTAVGMAGKVTVLAVPEPATAGLIVLAAGGVLAGRRGRRH